MKSVIFNKAAAMTGFGLGLLGVLGVLYGTRSYGAGISPDSVAYISCAHSLLEGEGFVRSNGLYVSWPPLFPMILAFLGFFGLDPADSARYFNAACFGLIIFFFHMLLRKYLKSQILAAAGAMAVLFNDLLIKSSMMVWSEPFFILLGLWTIMLVHKLILKPSPALLALASAAVAMAAVQRYMGTAFIASGALLIFLFMADSRWVKRIVYSATFFIGGCIPLAVWFLRNSLVEGVPTHTGVQTHTLLHFAMAAPDVITNWFFPEIFSIPFWMRVCIIVGALAAAAFMTGVPRPRQKDLETPQARLAIVFTVVFIVYVCAVTLATYLITGADARVFVRYLLPVYMCFVFLVAYYLDWTITRTIGAGSGGKSFKAAIFSICFIWIGMQVLNVAGRSSQVLDNPRKMLGWIEKAAQMDPTPAILMSKGKALMDDGNYALAAEAFEQSALKSGNPGSAWLMCGKAAIKSENRTLAVRALERASQCESVQAEAKKLLQSPPESNNN